MLLCLDVGNSHIFGGVFEEETLQLHFRYATDSLATSDQLGLFFKAILREHHIAPEAVRHIAVSSVVPSIDYSLSVACKKYFDITPFFLKPDVATGLHLDVTTPLEVGADRIANAVSAVHYFPKKNIIIIDFGTATTFCAIDAQKNYLGGAIMLGLKTAMQALSQKTAKLGTVEIKAVDTALGKTTSANVQAGLYYSQLGAITKIVACLTQEAFPNEAPFVVATGGFAYLFEKENLFDVIVPDLVLQGLRMAFERHMQGTSSPR